MRKKPVIRWTKQKNPFDEEAEEITDFDAMKDLGLDVEEDEDFLSTDREYAKGIMTQMGVVPLNEFYNPFNFWTGHTNFKINKTVKNLIESCDGIEALIILSPLRFKICIGRAWKMKEAGEVLIEVQKTLENFYDLVYNNDEDKTI